MRLLRMGCYGDDRDHSFLRAVIPKDPIGSWGFLLDISFKDLLPFRPFERAKFMCVQRRMAEVGFEKPQAFSDAFKGIFLKGIVLDLPKICIGLGCENQFVHGLLFNAFGKRSALDGTFLRKPRQDFS